MTRREYEEAEKLMRIQRCYQLGVRREDAATHAERAYVVGRRMSLAKSAKAHWRTCQAFMPRDNTSLRKLRCYRQFATESPARHEQFAVAVTRPVLPVTPPVQPAWFRRLMRDGALRYMRDI